MLFHKIQGAGGAGGETYEVLATYAESASKSLPFTVTLSESYTSGTILVLGCGDGGGATSYIVKTNDSGGDTFTRDTTAFGDGSGFSYSLICSYEITSGSVSSVYFDSGTGNIWSNGQENAYAIIWLPDSYTVGFIGSTNVNPVGEITVTSSAITGTDVVGFGCCSNDAGGGGGTIPSSGGDPWDLLAFQDANQDTIISKDDFGTLSSQTVSWVVTANGATIANEMTSALAVAYK